MLDDTVHGLGALAGRVAALSDAQMEATLSELAGRAGGSIEVSDVPYAESKPYVPHTGCHAPAPKRFKGRIERDWRISSFSALTSGKEELAELPDRDLELAENRSGTRLRSSQPVLEPAIRPFDHI
jgi:exodeoxyribonuclease V beta subunit